MTEVKRPEKKSIVLIVKCLVCETQVSQGAFVLTSTNAKFVRKPEYFCAKCGSDCTLEYKGLMPEAVPEAVPEAGQEAVPETVPPEPEPQGRPLESQNQENG